MRPRISRKEASYIVEVLNAQEPMLRQKQDRLKDLKLKMFTLEQRLKREGSIQVFQELKPVKEEYGKLNAEAYTIYKALELHRKLIEKYQAIAEGVSHQGTYKHLNTGLEWRLAITETEKISEVLTA